VREAVRSVPQLLRSDPAQAAAHTARAQQALRALPPEAQAQAQAQDLWRECEAECVAVCAALHAALLSRVTFAQQQGGGGARLVAPGAREAVDALWEALERVGGEADAAQALAQGALAQLLEPMLAAPAASAQRVGDGAAAALSWAQAEEGEWAERSLPAAATALEWFAQAVLCARPAATLLFGAALWEPLSRCVAARALALCTGPPAQQRALLAAQQLQERAAAAGIGASGEGEGLGAALRRAFRERQAQERAAWLDRARAHAAGDAAGAQTTVRCGGAWRLCAGEMRLGEVGEVSEGVGPPIRLPPCPVPPGALAIACMLDEAVEDAGRCADAALLYAACALPPPQARTPGAAMLFRNAAALLACRLAGLAACMAPPAPSLLGVCAALRCAGEGALADAVAAAAADSAAALDGADGFARAALSPDAVGNALRGAVHLARRFDALAHSLLPPRAAARAAAQVMLALERRVCQLVLALPDIGADDCAALCGALDGVLDPAADGTPPGWHSLASLRLLLGAPLRHIAADAASGTGLCACFSLPELRTFLLAAFEDSTLRAETLHSMHEQTQNEE